MPAQSFLGLGQSERAWGGAAGAGGPLLRAGLRELEGPPLGRASALGVEWGFCKIEPTHFL